MAEAIDRPLQADAWPRLISARRTLPDAALFSKAPVAGYSAASMLTFARAVSEHSVMVAEARAIGFVL